MTLQEAFACLRRSDYTVEVVKCPTHGLSIRIGSTKQESVTIRIADSLTREQLCKIIKSGAIALGQLEKNA